MNFNWDDFNWDALGAIGQDWRQSRQQTNQIQLQTLLQQIAEQKAEAVRDERRLYDERQRDERRDYEKDLLDDEIKLAAKLAREKRERESAATDKQLYLNSLLNLSDAEFAKREAEGFPQMPEVEHPISWSTLLPSIKQGREDLSKKQTAETLAISRAAAEESRNVERESRAVTTHQRGLRTQHQVARQELISRGMTEAEAEAYLATQYQTQAADAQRERLLNQRKSALEILNMFEDQPGPQSFSRPGSRDVYDLLQRTVTPLRGKGETDYFPDAIVRTPFVEGWVKDDPATQDLSDTIETTYKEILKGLTSRVKEVAPLEEDADKLFSEELIRNSDLNSVRNRLILESDILNKGFKAFESEISEVVAGLEAAYLNEKNLPEQAALAQKLAPFLRLQAEVDQRLNGYSWFIKAALESGVPLGSGNRRQGNDESFEDTFN